MSNDDPKLHNTDKALIDAAMTGQGTVPLTSDLVKAIGASIRERSADIAARYPKLVEECPYETRLAVVAWVFQHIVNHARDGGSFRYLIYERLDFESDAYLPLYEAGGMVISNEFNLPLITATQNFLTGLREAMDAVDVQNDTPEQKLLAKCRTFLVELANGSEA